MKNIIILCLLLVFGISFSQEFILTPENFKSKDDNSKDYVVIEFPNYNQKELFDKTKMFITSNYRNLKNDGLNEVEYSQLKLRSRVVGTKVKLLGSESVGSYLTTTYDINFKDGKIMIKPFFNDFEPEVKDGSKIFLVGGSSYFGKSIFKKDGKIWLQNHYNAANEIVNNFVTDLKKSLTNSNNW